MTRYERKITDLDTQLAERNNENRVLKEMNNRLSEAKTDFETEISKFKTIAQDTEYKARDSIARVE